MYQLQCENHRQAFAIYSMDDVHAAPTKDQKMLMDAVADALGEGIFYTNDMQAYVEEQLKDVLPADKFITEAYKAKSIRTEGGPFGMDIYYCRKVMEQIIQKDHNRDILKVMLRDNMIAVGSTFKGELRVGSKRFTTVVIESINKRTGSVTLICSGRGHRGKYRATIGVSETRFMKLVSKEGEQASHSAVGHAGSQQQSLTL
jgi:late competence protein required for DNA uptake (superfamily II DNA/RNA helicase)